MPDTLRYLRTIRAVVADCPPAEFNVGYWGYKNPDGSSCGCLLGKTLMSQPLFAEEVGMSLHMVGVGAGTLLIDGGGNLSFDRIADRLGITYGEAIYLFSMPEYWNRIGEAGKAEALQHLDTVIDKYEHRDEPTDGEAVTIQQKELEYV